MAVTIDPEDPETVVVDPSCELAVEVALLSLVVVAA